MDHIRVLLVDDLQLILDGCMAILGCEPDIEVVGTARSGEQAVAIAQHQRSDVVVMDIDMPGGMNGIMASRCLRSLDPAIRIILLSNWNTREFIAEGIKAGVVGYVLKDTASTDLVHAIRCAARGGHIVHPQVLPNLFGIVHEPPHESVPHLGVARPVNLTEREWAMLHLMDQGMTNEKIMSLLRTPEGTFRTSRQKLYAKLGVHSREDALNEARRRGML